MVPIGFFPPFFLWMSLNTESFSYASFLWKYLGDDVGDVKIFKWTGRNGYVALCEPGFISFGGG